MLHLPLLSVYFIAYKLLLAYFNSSSLQNLIVNAKSIEHMDSLGLVGFLLILIPLSLFMQEKIFTTLQIKLNEKMLNRRSRKKINNI